MISYTNPYDYQEIVDLLNKIEIRKEGDEVATYFDGRQTSRKSVSNRYEIFDFKPFMLQSIKYLNENFGIDKYSAFIYQGKQQLKLYSDEIDVNGKKFYKTFYILNSSDKTRALSLSLGMSNDEDHIHFISKKGTISKKHYKGITNYVNENFEIDTSVFDEMVDILKGIIGDDIYMSNVQRVITDTDNIKEAKVSYRNNFNSFRDRLFYDIRYNKRYSKDDLENLRCRSWFSKSSVESYINSKHDFIVDSYQVFKTYLNMFNNRDIADIKRESEKIKNLSIYNNRVNVLDKILEDGD